MTNNFIDYNSIQQLSEKDIQREQAAFMTKVYGWMSFAMILTGLTAYWVASSPSMIDLIFGSRFTFFALIIGEILLVGYLSAAISRMSANTATLVFVFYSFLNGLTLSVIFSVFTASSIASTFFITAVTFAIMSVYGYFTKKDLTAIGSLLFMALIGVIIASVVNMFFASGLLSQIINYAGVIIFIGLTAYDTQKVKQMNIIGNEGTDEDHKEAIMGALTLYLDFINLFLFLLRLFGDRK